MIALGALTLLLSSSKAFAGHEILERFRLRSCVESTCVAVDAAESRRSPLDAAYVFKEAKIELARKTSEGIEPSRTFKVSGGYYDPKFGYLVLHGRPGGLINLETGRVTLLEPLVERRAVLARNLTSRQAPRRGIQLRK